MTDETMALRALLEKTSDAEFRRELLGFGAQRLMELEVEGRCGASYGERNAERTNQRNGYRDREWQTRVGAVELRIPKLRKSLPLRRQGGATTRAFWSRGVRPRRATASKAPGTARIRKALARKKLRVISMLTGVALFGHWVLCRECP